MKKDFLSFIFGKNAYILVAEPLENFGGWHHVRRRRVLGERLGRRGRTRRRRRGVVKPNGKEKREKREEKREEGKIRHRLKSNWHFHIFFLFNQRTPKSDVQTSPSYSSPHSYYSHSMHINWVESVWARKDSGFIKAIKIGKRSKTDSKETKRFLGLIY